RFGWLAAVRRGQLRLHAGLGIDVPILVMCSARSVRPRPGDDGLTRADVVLDVEHIARWSVRLGPRLTLVRIEDGLHDLVLSAEPARKRTFAELDRWLTAHF
ncbi:MAG: alpha/beta hydrolase, partial [Actinomadura sp.]